MKIQNIVSLKLLTLLLAIPSYSYSQVIESDPFNSCTVAPSTTEMVWNSKRIQEELSSVIENRLEMFDLSSTYAVLYKELVYWRDQERCYGYLQADNLIYARLNHLLSSTTSRLLIQSLETCAKKDLEFSPSFGICDLQQKISQRKYDTLSVAIESAAIYLSSHLAIALASLPYHDSLWDNLSDESVSGFASKDIDVLKKRIVYLKKFKPVYEKYTIFLRNNLLRGVKKLKSSCYINGDLTEKLTNLATVLPIAEIALDTIRDKTFEAALKYAEEGQGTILVSKNGLVNTEEIDFSIAPPSYILDLEHWSRKIVSNDATSLLYRSVLGGKTQDQLNLCQ